MPMIIETCGHCGQTKEFWPVMAADQFGPICGQCYCGRTPEADYTEKFREYLRVQRDLHLQKQIGELEAKGYTVTPPKEKT